MLILIIYQTHSTPSEKPDDDPLQKNIKFAYLHILQLQLVGSYCMN